MINKIINIIKKHDDIKAYSILEQKSSKAELYYVLDKLETNRLVDTVDYRVTIFKEFENDMLGQATVGISLSYTDEDIENKINDAI